MCTPKVHIFSIARLSFGLTATDALCPIKPMAWDPHAATCARKMASLISRDEDPYFCKIENRCSAKYSNVRCNIWHLWYMRDACLDLWKLELFVFCLLRNCLFFVRWQLQSLPLDLYIACPDGTTVSLALKLKRVEVFQDLQLKSFFHMFWVA